MKLVEMKCPSCGAQLHMETDKNSCFCKYCGVMILLDDEKQHIVYDNAEETGFQFEIGRQKAKDRIQQEKNLIAGLHLQEAQKHDQQERQNRLYASKRNALCQKCGNYYVQYSIKDSTALGLLYINIDCPVCGNTWKIEDKHYLLKLFLSGIFWIFCFWYMLPLYLVKKIDVSYTFKIVLYILFSVVESVLFLIVYGLIKRYS